MQGCPTGVENDESGLHSASHNPVPPVHQVKKCTTLQDANLAP